MNMYEIRDVLETAQIEMDRVMDLISIVLTEVFDECQGSKGDYFGKLFPYEHSFESVLICALDLLKSQSGKFSDIQNQISEALDQTGQAE